MAHPLPPLLLAVTLLVGILAATGTGVAVGVSGPDSVDRVDPSAHEAVITPGGNTSNDDDEIDTYEIVDGHETESTLTVNETSDEVDQDLASVNDLSENLTESVSLDGQLEGATAIDLDDGNLSLTGSVSTDLESELATSPSIASGDPTTSASRASGAGEPADDGNDDGGLPPITPPVGGAIIGGAAVATGLAGRSLLVGADGAGGIDASARIRDVGHPLAAKLRDALRPVLGLVGYQRYDDSNPLEHEGRARLFERVRAAPGINLTALSAAADLPLSTTRYHVRILEHEGLLRTEKFRGKRRYFPPDTDGKALTAALAEEAPSRVLRSLVREGPASVSRLAERLDRAPSTVSHHLDRLEADGLVERERDGPAVISRALPTVERAIATQPAAETTAPRPRPVATSD